MTAEQAAMWGGTAGVAFDPCYHQACDTFDNVDLVALDEMTDAIAHAILTFAMTTSAVQGTDKGSAKAATTRPSGDARHQVADKYHVGAAPGRPTGRFSHVSQSRAAGRMTNAWSSLSREIAPQRQLDEKFSPSISLLLDFHHGPHLRRREC